MSRIGKMPVRLPNGVTVKIESGNKVTIKGPKGELTKDLHPEMLLEQTEGEVLVKRPSDQKEHKALHGLTRSLLANMVQGVSEGYSKSLEIKGVGYRAALQGNTLVLNMGYSHPVEFQLPKGIEVEVPVPTKITVRGIDKQLVGEFAANIRAVRRPEPYLGKGIRYADEVVRRKAGKSGKA